MSLGKMSSHDWESLITSTDVYQREECLEDGASVDLLTNEDYTAALAEIHLTNEFPKLTRQVGKILDRLSDRQRNIIRLRYWQGKTLQEIANALSIRYQSVQDSIKASERRIEKELRMIAAKISVTNKIDC